MIEGITKQTILKLKKKKNQPPEISSQTKFSPSQGFCLSHMPTHTLRSQNFMLFPFCRCLQVSTIPAAPHSHSDSRTGGSQCLALHSAAVSTSREQQRKNESAGLELQYILAISRIELQDKVLIHAFLLFLLFH